MLEKVAAVRELGGTVGNGVEPSILLLTGTDW